MTRIYSYAIMWFLTLLIQPVLGQNESEFAPNHLIIVVGASGEAEYADEFSRSATHWVSLSEKQGWTHHLIEGPVSAERLPVGDASNESELDAKRQLEMAIKASLQANRLWIVLIGHGTFSGTASKFNLVGPDVSSKEMATWLKPVQSEIIVVNCASASAPFLQELGGPNRVMVTATRNGTEQNFARFGRFMSEAILDASVDIDHDKEVSLLEAFLAASSNTERFYENEARLATEHALLDDNGDRVGTSADFYRGVRPVKASKTGKAVDGALAARIILLSASENASFPEALQKQRAEIEQAIDQLRGQKSLLSEADYFDSLELLMLQLAELYDQAEIQATAEESD